MKKGRLLVVDDEPLILTLASAILSRHGHEVTTATDGLTALKLCSSKSFDLVLTDVVMPYMDGPELVRQLKESYQGVPTLFMSGFVNRDDLPADSILGKPFNQEQLINAIDARIRACEK